MAKLPTVSGRDVIQALCRRFGYRVRGQRGSHVMLVHAVRSAVTVPLHGEVAKGTLRSILRQARIDREEFLAALD